MKTVLYIYGNLPAYRKDFFTQLDKQARENGIGIKILYGYVVNKETKQASGDAFDAQRFETKVTNLKFLRVSRMKGLVQQVKKENPDGIIFQWNQTNLSEWGVLRYCKKQHIPYGIWGCNYTRADLIKPLAWLREQIYHPLYKNASVLIPYGTLYRDYFIKLGIKSEKIIVAQNTINVEQIVESHPFKQKGKNEAVRVLYVGAIAPQKRIETAVLAVANLIKSGVKLEFDIVGGGNLLSLYNYIEEFDNDISKHIRVHGAKYGKELENFFLNADVFLMPGTGGLGVNEAMAYGLPIISTLGDETIYDLMDGNGFLLQKNGDVEAQMDALKKFSLLLDEERSAMRKRSQLLITERASLANMVKQHVEACKLLIK